jgi:hypothetical protein
VKELTEAEIDRASAKELRCAYRELVNEARELRAKIKAGVREAFDARREQNLKLGGYVPYGKKADVTGKLRRSPSEQEVIALILQLRRQKRSLRDISRTLATQGFMARCDRPFQPKQIARILRAHDRPKAAPPASEKEVPGKGIPSE